MRHIPPPGPKRPLEIDGALLDEAAALSLDLPAVVETALRGGIAAEKAKRWREENAEAIASNNARLEREGLWCDEYRLF